LSRKKKKVVAEKAAASNDSPSVKVNKVKPKTKNQRDLLQSIYHNEIVFGVGPAGTGKTHVGVGAGIDLLQRRVIQKIVITRPIIEAGQKRHNNKSVIGYLPGGIDEKMSPFLRPIHDELTKFVGNDAIQIMKNKGILEICPLEHMRGRTFENTYVIADEMQNATDEQIEMLLTRLGIGSTMVLVGDLDQSDLPNTLEGGFGNFIEDLEGIEGLSVVYLEAVDVQRSPIVRRILERLTKIRESISKPISWKDGIYDRQSSGHTSKNAGSERKHDANPNNSLDGFIQEDIQGNDLS